MEYHIHNHSDSDYDNDHDENDIGRSNREKNPDSYKNNFLRLLSLEIRCDASLLPRHAAAGLRAQHLVFQLQGRRPFRSSRHGGRPREPDGDDRPDRDAVDVRLPPPAGHPHPGGGGEGPESLARPSGFGGRERFVRPRLAPGALSLAPGVYTKDTVRWRNLIEL